MSSQDPKIITHAITRFLARREHSKTEIMQKLLSKDLDERMCYEQLQKFIEKGIQSDSRYLEAYVRSAYQKGKGPNVIRQTLISHSIEGTEVSESINQEQYDWYELAKQVRIKKFGHKLPTEFKHIQKQKRFLQYRGFEQPHIQYAFDKD